MRMALRPYSVENMDILSYRELLPKLPENNPIHNAYLRSRKKDEFLKRGFFVYFGDIISDQPFSIDLKTFYPQFTDFYRRRVERDDNMDMPFWYPVILGSLKAPNILYYGYTAGSIAADNLFAYNAYGGINFANGCGGDFTIREIMMSDQTVWQIGGRTRIHTWVSQQDKSKIACADQTILHHFHFPKKNRADVFDLHSKEEILAHFSCEEAVNRWYGSWVASMLPVEWLVSENQDADISLLKQPADSRKQPLLQIPIPPFMPDCG